MQGITRNLVPGDLERMGSRHMDVDYRGFDPEVHEIVEFLLGTDAEIVRTATKFEDSPAVALQAMRLKVGETLPAYAVSTLVQPPRGTSTRIIEPSDLFVIAEHPNYARYPSYYPGPSPGGPPGFTAVLQRERQLPHRAGV